MCPSFFSISKYLYTRLGGLFHLENLRKISKHQDFTVSVTLEHWELVNQPVDDVCLSGLAIWVWCFFPPNLPSKCHWDWPLCQPGLLLPLSQTWHWSFGGVPGASWDGPGITPKTTTRKPSLNHWSTQNDSTSSNFQKIPGQNSGRSSGGTPLEHHWRYHCWLVIRCFFMIYPTLVIPIYYPCWIPIKHIYEIQLNSIKSPLVKEAWYKHVGSGPSSWSFAASASSSASVLRIDIVQKKTCGKSHPASD